MAIVNSTSEPVPVFGSDFAGLMSFLQSDASPLISTERFGLVFGRETQTLANLANVHGKTMRLAPDAESVQSHLRESLRVISVAAEVSGSVETAIHWFKNHSMPAFDFKTPQFLVSENRSVILIDYLRSLKAGYCG